MGGNCSLRVEIAVLEYASAHFIQAFVQKFAVLPAANQAAFMCNSSGPPIFGSAFLGGGELERLQWEEKGYN